MAAVAFDTHRLVRKLQDTAQMTQAQAEGVAEAMAEAMSVAELATKTDIDNTKKELKHEIDTFRTELKHDIRELELKMDGRFKEVYGQFKEIDKKFEMVLERIDRRAAESDARLYKYALAAIGTVVVSFFGAAVAIIRYLPIMPH
jgi:hypothetical protein